MSLNLGFKVVVPVDYSELTAATLSAGIEAADCPEAVTVLHVAPDLTILEPGVDWGEVSDDSRRKQLTAAFRKRFPEFSHLAFEVIFGDAGHQIARFAEQVGATLIVIPSHGKTGLRHLLIGSTAERVVRFSHCPVLVLRS